LAGLEKLRFVRLAVIGSGAAKNRFVRIPVIASFFASVGSRSKAAVDAGIC
jgi:hypothetical protein